MKIVKYFNAEKNWQDYERGSFKIGTLEEYRKSEEPLARMLDDEEGIATDSYGQGGGYIERMNLPNGGLILNCTFTNVGSAVGLRLTINTYVFCASFGAYSREHHELIVGGIDGPDGATYAGNKDLDAYAEIDAKKFLSAFDVWRSSAGNVRHLKRGKVFGRRVEYRERARQFALKPVSSVSNNLDSDRFLRTIFFKPVYFRPENEFRMAFSDNYPSLLPAGASPLYPRSKLLRDSIVCMGKL